jgi:acyl carrier protein
VSWFSFYKKYRADPALSTREVVIKEVRWFLKESENVALQHSLSKDLGIVSDDLTDLCLRLEYCFDVKPPRDEYRSIKTVSDLIALFEKYRAQQAR